MTDHDWSTAALGAIGVDWARADVTLEPDPINGPNGVAVQMGPVRMTGDLTALLLAFRSAYNLLVAKAEDG